MYMIMQPIVKNFIQNKVISCIIDKILKKKVMIQAINFWYK